jgi:DNA topoisomerase-1
VQTATLHIVVQRESAREAFEAEPFWTVQAVYKEGFSARFARQNPKGELVEAKLASEEEAKRIVAEAAAPHVVRAVREQTLEQKPKPPFTTSTLQQAASAQLGLKPADAMRIAQLLFEAGCISYHRTDSVALSDEAIAMAREFIAHERADLLPKVPPLYRAGDAAQGAHEAIRPTSLETSLDVPAEGRALFDLVRRRFLASQCKPALIAQQIVTISAGETRWLAKGSVEAFDGHRLYLKYDENADKEKGEDDEQLLPALAVGDGVNAERIEVKRSETKPPPRFTQATLIREMERLGIGRPSTYAATLKTLFDRSYLEEQKKAVAPTARGRVVDGALSKAFTSLVESSYTAELEARLDDIATGKRRWKDELQLWFQTFEPQLRSAGPVIATFSGPLDTTSASSRPCPLCGSRLVARRSAKGPFLGCSSYPQCRHLEPQPALPVRNRRAATKKETQHAKSHS